MAVKAHPGGLSRAVDLMAAGGLTAAVGYAVVALTGQTAWAAAAAVFTFAAVFLAMARIEDSPRLALPIFDAVPVEASGASPLPELLLTELTELLLDERTDDALLLDDKLVAPGENSRVIRLFDPRTLPTPGELQGRIQDHLNDSRSCPDATAELHQALSDLRSALR